MAFEKSYIATHDKEPLFYNQEVLHINTPINITSVPLKRDDY